MAVITSLAPTTELEAVNTMLAAIGEAPITDLASLATDVVMALNILRNATRDLQHEGWRFNMEWGFELEPTDTQAWMGSDTSSAVLNIFTAPAGLARFTVSQCDGQIGDRKLDLVLRAPRKWHPVSGPTPPVFYDRAKNRDGLDATRYSVLYIDPVWFVDFEQMPECARRFATVRAARQLAQQAVGSTELAGFSSQDEAAAYKVLRRLEGQEDDDLNLFDNMADMSAFAGMRSSSLSVGLVDPRKSPGTA